MLLASIVFLTFTSCNLSVKDEPADQSENDAKSSSVVNVAGTYVSKDYDNRNGGYDWVGVVINQNEDSSINIKIRSRADQKKPTCTLDARAEAVGGGQFKAVLEEKAVLFIFNADKLEIRTENETDASILSFFCSGGGTLKGTYTKTEGDLDPDQVDKRIFQKVLSLQDISFAIESKREGDKQLLTIMPSGLSIVNAPFTHDITGQSIVGTEIEDMNKDGYPELLVYT